MGSRGSSSGSKSDKALEAALATAERRLAQLDKEGVPMGSPRYNSTFNEWKGAQNNYIDNAFSKIKNKRGWTKEDFRDQTKYFMRGLDGVNVQTAVEYAKDVMKNGA